MCKPRLHIEIEVATQYRDSRVGIESSGHSSVNYEIPPIRQKGKGGQKGGQVCCWLFSKKGGHKGGQVCCWLFSNNLLICSACFANFFSLSTLAFMLKQAELTEEYFSKPSTAPISRNLCPPNSRHRYMAIARASFPCPRRFFLNSSSFFP